MRSEELSPVDLWFVARSGRSFLQGQALADGDGRIRDTLGRTGSDLLGLHASLVEPPGHVALLQQDEEGWFFSTSNTQEC